MGDGGGVWDGGKKLATQARRLASRRRCSKMRRREKDGKGGEKEGDIKGGDKTAQQRG